MSTNQTPASRDHKNGPGETENTVKDGKSPPNHPIFDAIKSGMLVPVQTAAEDGPSVFSLRDDKGHTPAHWACLGGHTVILRFILDNKGPVDEASNNELGARPIHWACVNGHVAIVDILLQAGVSIDVVDNKGCTPLIVAAQYGHTMLAGYLMGKGARLQIVDRDGDNALHWAAFKGQNELMRLLIYSGFNPRQRDNYGQTSLHLSCINGNLTAVKELCEQDGAELDLKDKNGKTPLMLASGRKHQDVIEYLRRQIKSKNSFIPKLDILSIAFGPPGNSKVAILFFMVNVLCWGYPMYIIKCLPYTWYDLMILHIIFFILNIIMWFSLFHASTTDPGYLPRNVPEYDLAIKQVAHFDEWKQGENPLSRLCHTCRLVKPLRSKHCRVCNRCIKVFDHHCPYIYNCVGYKNRVTFISFVTCVGMLGPICMFLSVYTINNYMEWNWIYKIYMAIMVFFEITAGSLFIGGMWLAAVNLTTNEYLKHKKYKHLVDENGKLKYAFNQGILNNFLDYFHIKPLQEEEISDQIMITTL
ncbi:uncharacterized protein LOC127714155 isoform X1 [Mytilus californianus]|uniref:uncharacterized protein LOC127714155 isoform X1 n=1 Tax=Mytilus californianus TaxID=6549 RepID=UPI00224735C9|nr:uncharacterized protein LOC127714155 isoform X1 [Mytilus californianus]